mmetsp:Transcript_173892/g.557353  ORF Transcript_173892/g.557353 Transcript_173892/m.557353 type:complete len:252 (-) Transcript_173892:21-776(-)
MCPQAVAHDARAAAQGYTPGLQTLFGLSLEEWLEGADGVAAASSAQGRLLRHRPALLRNFDSVEQIAALYLFDEQGNPGQELAEDFFRDLGVAAFEQREALQASFRAALATPAVGSRSRNPPDACAGGAGGGAGDGGGPAVSLRGWLLEVDDSGSLAHHYLARLQDNYDTPEQVCRLYAAGAAWSHLFFQDLQVLDPRHRGLFSVWLASRGLGAGGGGRSAPAALPSPRPPPRHAADEGRRDAEPVFDSVD